MSPSAYRESIDRTSPIPVYLQIANDMSRRIAEEEWRIGDQIMPEITLSELYDSSRVTMRQALSRLEDEGLISRKRGGRAIVTAKPQYVIQELQVPGPDNKLPVVNPSQQIVSTNIHISELREPNRRAAKMLHLPEDAPLIYLERHFESGRQTVGINRAWFPRELFPDLAENGLVDRSVSTTLRSRYACDTAAVENYIAAITLDAHFAGILQVPYGSPALRVDSVHSRGDNRPIQFASTIWNGQNAQFHLVVSR